MSSPERVLPTQLAPRRPARAGVPEVYALLALASFLVARFLPVLDVHYPCPFRSLTGIPCATCGMTHAFVHLAHGRVAEALAWSPLGACLAAGAWAFVLADVVRVVAGWPLPRVSLRQARALAFTGAGALATNWAFVVLHRMGP